MRYEGIVIRPPSEAGSLILQVTLGCSHNKCTFCPTYKKKKFKIRPIESIRADLKEVGGYGRIRRIFLADGDALIIPQKSLVPIFDSVNEYIYGIDRIGIYGNVKSVLRKTPEELSALKERGLGIIYMGLESGDGEILKKVKKGTGPEDAVEAARRVREAEILLSVTVLLGVGGRNGSMRHAQETGKILSDMNPDFIGALTLMLVPGTPLYEDEQKGAFVLPDQMGFLEELYLILKSIDVNNCLFTSNHASNYLPLRVNLPDQKDEAISLIRNILDEERIDLLRPESTRGL
jgi:radical SAM superfamily enzyme YgiQ (UPF0313 family)